MNADEVPALEPEAAPESPAALLRCAAALMRERAEAATPGPWWSDDSENCWRLNGVAFRTPPFCAEDGTEIIPGQVANHQILKAPKHSTPYAEYWPSGADAAWITGMHPVVGLAVAAWLEDRVADYDQLESDGYGVTGAQFVMSAEGGDEDPAITVARAYLGEGGAS